MKKHKPHGFDLRSVRSKPSAIAFHNAIDPVAVHSSYGPISLPKSLSKHECHGRDRSKHSSVVPQANNSTHAHLSIQPSNHDLSTTVSLMALHVERLRGYFCSSSIQGIVSATEPYIEIVKILVKQLQQYPDDLRPSAAFCTAYYAVSVTLETFHRKVLSIRFSYLDVPELIRCAEDGLDMVIATIHSLMELFVHELDERLRRKAEIFESSHSSVMFADQEAIDKAAIRAPYSRRSLDNEVPKTRTRKNSILGVVRKISSIHLRKPNTTVVNPDHQVHSAPIHYRSKHKASTMLTNIRHSVTRMPKPMRDSMVKFVMLPKSSLRVDEFTSVPHIEYHPDGNLHKASLKGLVAVITSSCAVEIQEIVAMVLMTFRLFSSGRKLAKALRSRYREKHPPGLPDNEFISWVGAKDMVKLRIIVILHQWLNLNWKPEDCAALEILLSLVTRYVAQDSIAERDALLSVLKVIRDDPDYHGSRYLTVDRTAQVPPTKWGMESMSKYQTIPDNYIILDWASSNRSGICEELAVQLTILSSEFYHKTCPDDFVHWKNPRYDEVRRDWYNANSVMRYWVIETILFSDNPKIRAQVFEFWIAVAMKCRDLRNYADVHTIVSALQSGIFEAMPCTTNEISKSGKNKLKKLVDLLTRDRWWDEMTCSSQPAIPIPAIIYQWRVRIEETGAKSQRYKATKQSLLCDFISQERIDVDAFLNLADIIWDLEYTYACHNLTPIYWMQKFIKSGWSNPKFHMNYAVDEINKYGRAETQLLQSGQYLLNAQRTGDLSGLCTSGLCTFFDRIKRQRLKPLSSDKSKEEKPRKRRELVAAPTLHTDSYTKTV